jgi:hypothetical protein
MDSHTTPSGRSSTHALVQILDYRGLLIFGTIAAFNFV